MDWTKGINSKAFIYSGTLLSVILLPGCDSNNEQPAIEKPAVSVFQIQSEEVGQHLEFVARTEPNQSVEL